MSVQTYVCLVAALSCYVFALWQVFDVWYVAQQSVPTPAFVVSTNHCNTLIKDKDNYYAHDIVELNQFRKAVGLHRKRARPAPRMNDFKYTIKSACDAKGITIAIEELYKARHTRGGSSFRVVSTSAKIRHTCSFHDFFNGTYVAFCLMNEADCVNVTLSIMYVNFTAYTHKKTPENKFLWRGIICSTGCNATTAQQLPQAPTALQKRVHLQNRMSWRSHNGSSKLVIRDGINGTWREYQPISKPDLCSCLRRRGRVILIGSSHMRYKGDDIFTRCYSFRKSLPRKHESLTIDNVVFIWRRFLTDYVDIWKKHLAPLNVTRGDIVFVQTGAWDLSQKKLDYILGPGLALFKKALADVRDRLTARGASLVVVTLPPYSHLSHNTDRGSRNNFAIAAFNARITSAAVDLNLSVHDEFGVILPHCEAFVCYSHYLCRVPETNKVYGAVGLVSSNMMLKTVCDAS